MDKNTHLEAEKDFNTLAASLGIKIIAWRDVPVDSNAIGVVARKSEPVSRQVFVTADLDKEELKKQVRRQRIKSFLNLNCKMYRFSKGFRASQTCNS